MADYVKTGPFVLNAAPAHDTPAFLNGVENRLVGLNKAVTSTDVATIVQLTQAAYDALATKDPATLYVIVG